MPLPLTTAAIIVLAACHATQTQQPSSALIIAPPTGLSLLARFKKEISDWFTITDYRLPDFTCSHKVMYPISRQMLA
jgi:hypothetical protein